MSGSIYRKSCYNCKYAKRERLADVTLGDTDYCEDGQIYSSVILYSDKANVIFKQIKGIKKVETELECMLNSHAQLNAPMPITKEQQKFEKYCEASSKIKYWYKNGESSDEFFSIVYLDKMNKAWTFYPDYIVGDTKGNIWIIETKGGEDAYGYSKNIDIKIENKYEALKTYAQKYNLKWGFVRDIDEELYISNADDYIEDMKSTNWMNLKNYEI